MAEESKIEQAPSAGSGHRPSVGSPSETAESAQRTGPGDELSSLRQALADRESRLTKLEETLKNAERRGETQDRELVGRDKEIASLREGLGVAAAKFRKMLLAGSPEVPEELIRGETVEEVEASFAQARQVVERVRRGLEAKRQQERVPAGAPPRSPMDLSALSPQEKIAFALARR